MRYAYKCPRCGYKALLDERGLKLQCPMSICSISGPTADGVPVQMVRDYKAEGVSVALVPGGAKMSLSTTYWDRDLVQHDFGDTFNRDNVMEHRLRVKDAIEDEG